MIVTFVGHGSLFVSTALRERIASTIKEVIKDKTNVMFYCGGYGDFDNLCASICRRLKEEIKCEIVYVTPYITEVQQKRMQELIDSKIYDSTIYPPIENTLPRYAITKRNEWMISEADIIIAFVSRTYGGAYKAFQYALRKKKTVINLAE